MAYQITAAAAARDYYAGVTTSPFRCIYEKPNESVGGVTESLANLYVCHLPTPSPAILGGALNTNCAANTKRNLLIQNLHQDRSRLGVQMAASGNTRLRVANTTFALVSTVGNPAVAATALSVNVRFDLSDGSLYTSQFESGVTPIVGLRFGFNVVLRN